MAICPFCNIFITSKEQTKVYKTKKYHIDCFEKILDDMESGDGEREKLNKYICKLFHITAVTPLIADQINNMTKINGYTLTGIYSTLYYFFELEEREVGENVKGIGIVPFVYDEAKVFFGEIHKSKEANKDFKPTNIVTQVKIKRPDKSIKKIDISTIE